MNFRYLSIIALACLTTNLLAQETTIHEQQRAYIETLIQDAQFCKENAPISSAVIEVTNQQGYEQNVLKSEKTVVILVSATWCPPCQIFKPIFYKVAADFCHDFTFVHIEFDKFEEFIQQHQIEFVPMLLICKQGEIIAQGAASMPKAKFEQLLQDLRNQK